MELVKMIDLLNTNDIRLRTLANLPTTISSFNLSPVSLRTIADIGYHNYTQYLSVFTLSLDQLIENSYLNIIPEETQVYDVIFTLFEDEPLLHIYKSALKFFLQTDDVLYENGLHINGHLITQQLYQQIVNVIHVQNSFEQKDRNHFNPKNDRVRKLKEKMLNNKRKIQNLKSEQDENQLTLLDLVSVICSKANGINIFNVFELNMLQFNDQLNRMKLISDFELSVQQLLHGANPQKIELKHWISKSLFN